MKYVITQEGDPVNGLILSFPTTEDAEADARVGKHDPFFGSSRSLESYYLKEHLEALAKRLEIPEHKMRFVDTKHELAMLCWRAMSGEEVMSSEKARKTPRPKMAGATGGLRARLDAHAIIHMGQDEAGTPFGSKNNPKRQGTASYDRFAKYKEGISVQKALEAGVTPADIRHDLKKGFISLEEKSA